MYGLGRYRPALPSGLLARRGAAKPSCPSRSVVTRTRRDAGPTFGLYNERYCAAVVRD